MKWRPWCVFDSVSNSFRMIWRLPYEDYYRVDPQRTRLYDHKKQHKRDWIRE